MGHLWSSYGFDMGHYPPYQTVTERSHIIPIEKASEADEPLLWNIYGPCMGHNLPYQTHTFSLVRACWSCICRSLKFNVARWRNRVVIVRLRRTTRVTEFENDNL